MKWETWILRMAYDGATLTTLLVIIKLTVGM